MVLRTKNFETKYGLLESVSGFFLPGSPIFVLAQEVAIPAGTRTRAGRILKKAVRIYPGAILMPRRDEKYPGRRRWHIFSQGIYEAIRSLRRIRDGYNEENGGEIIFLEGAYRDFRVLASQLMVYRRLNADKRLEIEQAIDKYGAIFADAENSIKKDIAGRLAGASGLTDKTGRRNPMAAERRLGAVNRRLVLRLAEIHKIEPFIGMRQIALILEKNRIHRLLADVYWRMEKLAEVARNCRKILPRWEARNYWQTQLHVCLGELATVKVAPYPRWIKRLQRELGQIKDLLGRNKKENLPLFKELSARVCSVLRFKKARWELEEIIFEFSPVLGSSSPLEEETEENLRGRLVDFLERFGRLEEKHLRFKIKAEVSRLVKLAVYEGLVLGTPRAAKARLEAAAEKL